MRKANTDGLIYVKDVGFIVPGEWIKCDGRAVIGDSARTMLLEEAYHARAAGLAEISDVIQKEFPMEGAHSSVKPEGKRRGIRVFSSCKEPKP